MQNDVIREKNTQCSKVGVINGNGCEKYRNNGVKTSKGGVKIMEGGGK